MGVVVVVGDEGEAELGLGEEVVVGEAELGAGETEPGVGGDKERAERANSACPLTMAYQGVVRRESRVEGGVVVAPSPEM